MSDKQGWTPGPWQNYELPHNDGLHMGYIRPLDEDGMEIAHHGDMGRAGAVNKANGDLLAAAPALYAALEAICAERDSMLAGQGEDEGITGEEGRHFIEKSWQKWAQARAALLQARPEGGQK